MTVNVRKLFYDGGRLLQEEHAATEATKVGTLRVGNTGLYDSATDTWAGPCARRTFLRMKGIEVPEESNGAIDQTLMFEAGFKNEDSWVERLEKTWTGDGKGILREEEIAVSWDTASGIKVTGRPDVVLTQDGKPVHGIELKLMSSVWTVRDILTGSPKPGHLMQAGHYSWQLGVPYSLCYTLRADMAVLGFAVPLFPKLGQEGSQYCEYNERDKVIKKVKPFMKEYKLEWVGNTLAYTDTDTGIKKESIVTIERIKEYYEQIAVADKVLPRPLNLNPDGTKGGYTLCDYCSIKSTCDKYEGESLERWTDEVQRFARIQTGKK